MRSRFAARKILSTKLAKRGQELFRRVLPTAISNRRIDALAFCVNLLTLKDVTEDPEVLAELRREFAALLRRSFNATEHLKMKKLLAEIIVLLNTTKASDKKALENALLFEFAEVSDESEMVEVLACLSILDLEHPQTTDKPVRASFLKRKYPSM